MRFLQFLHEAIISTAFCFPAIVVAGNEPIDGAEKEEIRAVLLNYADMYTSLVMQTEITTKDLEAVYVDDQVWMGNDFGYGRNFQRPSDYYSSAETLFQNGKFTRQCSIVLTESGGYIFARTADGAYFVWLEKVIDYIDLRYGAQHFASCERIELRKVPGKGMRITSILKERVMPPDLNKNGIDDVYESRNPLYQREAADSRNAVWVTAHWKHTDSGWVWIDGYWKLQD